MKICLSTFRHKLSLTGEVESLSNLISGLRSKDIIVDCITPSGKINNFQKSFSTHKNANLLLSRFFDLFNLYKLLRKHSDEYDLIQIQVPTPTFCFVGDLLKFITKKKVFVIVESISIDVPLLKVFKASFKYNFAYYISRIFINNKYLGRLSPCNADGYIVSTLYQKEQLKRLKIDSQKIHVISNLTKIPGRIPSKDEAKNKFNVSEKFVFSYVGHFFHNKGIHLVCEAFIEFQKTYEDAYLMIAWSGLGNKKLVEKYLESIKDKFKIFHLVDIPTFLKATDVILIPYVYSFATHFFPNIILESYCLGVPIISSDLNITKELLFHEKTALLVESDSKNSLVKAMKRMYHDNALRSQLVDNQIEYFRNNLNPENVLQNFVNLYKSSL